LDLLVWVLVRAGYAGTYGTTGMMLDGRRNWSYDARENLIL